MTKTRQYGVLCKGCGVRMKLGDVELSESGQGVELRGKLLEEGWEAKVVPHLLNGCGHTTLYTLDDLTLLD